ncbi:hypothetical protein EWI07_12945 [Sporolactobacillus sp. THM7-4]|nr:hypothetical protein EWI07_12945 [Sporolactobacillus sp. THM7-4]
MNHYALFEEFDGRRSIPVDINHPKQIIVSETMLSAVQSFSKKNKLRLVDYDKLSDYDMRAFFNQKGLFKRSTELIYYIRQLPER